MSNLWFIVVRGLHIGSCLLIFGFWFFDLAIVRGFQSRIPRQVPEERMLRRALWFLWPVALLSTFAWLFLVAINMGGLSPWETLQGDTISTVLHQTEFGGIWQVHAWLAVAGCATTIVLLRPCPWIWPRWAEGLNLLILSTLVITLAWAGHGLVGTPQTARWHPWIDAAHLLISGIWPAGLLPLALSLPQWRESSDKIPIIYRFSSFSLFSVGLLMATGIFNAWILVGSWHNLFFTTYGWLLDSKIALFFLAILLGADNLIRLKPALQPSRASELSVTYQSLLHNLYRELALSFGILLLIAILGTLAPGQNP